MRNNPVSVCIALYNGQKFIRKQIDSILSQLINERDELIIIDDFSNDNSVEIVESYNNFIIRLYKNERNMGYIKTFEKAITLSRNEIIFLSDQDDIWIENRLIKMYDKLIISNSLLICSNFESFASETGSSVVRFKTRLSNEDASYNFKNILGIFKGNMAYFGCTMAFKSEFKKYLLPFPKYIDAHDLWLAMLGNVLGKIIHLEDNTLLHRIHGNNTSFVKRSLKEKLHTRILFFRSFVEAVKRKITT